MRGLALALAVHASAFAPAQSISRGGGPAMASFYDLSDTANDGSAVSFKQFEGKVCFAQNVASA